MLRNGESSYGWVSILSHWVIALLFLVQLPLGYMTQAAEGRPGLQFQLYQWHESVGFLILAIAVPRLAWALFAGRPRLPDTLTPSERAAAHVAHILLYAATVLVPLVGWAVVSTAPPDIPGYLFNLVVVPSLPLPPSGIAEAVWSSIHAFLAYGAGFLIAIHALAALRHHFHFHDDVLKRMILPGTHKQR